MKKNKKTDNVVVILNAGSGIVGLALAEAAVRSDFCYVVFSLSPTDFLRRMPGNLAYFDFSNFLNDLPKLKNEIVKNLSKLNSDFGFRIPILPTDDGSLRLLNEWKDDILKYSEFSRAKNLKMGGVDKSEVIELANNLNINKLSNNNKIIYSIDDVDDVFEKFGDDAIFKPALKPLAMDLSVMGSNGIKVIKKNGNNESTRNFKNRLNLAWSLSEKWIAQPRFQIERGLEKSVCSVRRDDSFFSCQVRELAKHPKIGGTAIWVKTTNEIDLVAETHQLLTALDVVGVSEASYLPDKNGNYQLVEINTRPWLQIGLVEFSDFPIVHKTINSLMANFIESNEFSLKEKHWVHLERSALAFFSRQLSLFDFFQLIIATLHKNTTIAGYSSIFPNVKRKLIKQSINKLLNF
jgi:hypothetical protein